MMARVLLFVMGVAAARRRLDDGDCADSTCWYVGGNPISDISPAALAATRRGLPRRAPPSVPSGCFCTPTEGSVPMAVREYAPR